MTSVMAPLHCLPSYEYDHDYLPDIDESTRSSESNKKSVRFAYCVDVCVVPSVSEMTEEEYRSTFYTKKDYKKIERDNQRTLLQMARENRVDVENDSLYFRGLEVYVKSAMEERQQRRNFVVSQILREQQVYGTIRKGWVENFSSRFTAPNMVAALRRGHFDMRATRSEEVDYPRQ